MDNALVRIGLSVIWLAVLWCIESLATSDWRSRTLHGIRNLSLAAVNASLLLFTLSSASVAACRLSPVAAFEDFPVLHAIACFVALDFFSYGWHRLNHVVPFLWRFHAVHHSDDEMDVTTAGRFHVGELVVGGLIRLPVLYLMGVSVTTLLVYETVLLLVSMFHHASISLGRWDRIIRVVITTPAMHSLHHSRNPRDFHSNFASIFSIWDRLFASFRVSSHRVSHGLDERDGQSLGQLIQMPFVETSRSKDSTGPARGDGKIR